MKISPYPTGRFKNYLEQKSAAFRDLIYQCQVNTRYFDAGEAILRQGEQLQYLYIVPVGRVSMSILAANGRRFQLGEANCDYHIYGEMEYFTQTLASGMWWLMSKCKSMSFAFKNSPKHYSSTLR